MNKFNWYVAAPFFDSASSPWLTTFISRKDVEFFHVASSYSHLRWRKRTSLIQWVDYVLHGLKTFFRARTPVRTGIVTVFPQLAFTVALIKLITGSQMPLVGWCFNVGKLPNGILRVISRRVLSQVNLFVVHSTAEAAAISECFAVPLEKVLFVPLQRPIVEARFARDADSPFIVALGTAQRDYDCLLNALEGLDIPLKIVATREAFKYSNLAPNVTILENLSIEACHELIQKSSFVVTPLEESPTAAGQVTLLDTMMYGKASISSNVVGITDYAAGGDNSMLVQAGSVPEMKRAICELWGNEELRKKMEENAYLFVKHELSDEKIAARLDAILIEFE